MQHFNEKSKNNVDVHVLPRFYYALDVKWFFNLSNTGLKIVFNLTIFVNITNIYQLFSVELYLFLFQHLICFLLNMVSLKLYLYSSLHLLKRDDKSHAQ